MAAATYRRFTRRAIRILAFAAGGLLGMVVLALVLLQFRPVRESVLHFALNRVVAVLPGELTLEEAAWPALGDLEFSGVQWHDGELVLAMADRVFISVSLGDLMKRDVLVHDLVVDRVSVNIPGILDVFESGENEPAEPRQEKGESGFSFPRAGALPGLPSISLEAFSISGTNIVLPDSSTIDTVAARGRFDVRTGQDPSLTLEQLIASSREEGWAIDHTDLALDPGGDIGGFSEGRLGEGWPYRLDLGATTGGSFELVLALGEEGAFSNPFGARITGDLGLDGSRVETVDFTAELALPAVDELARLPVLAEILESFPHLGPTRATLDGALGFVPDFRAEVSLLLHPGDWIERGEARFRYREGVLEVDTLGLALPDLVLQASGRLGEEITAEASATVTGVTWLEILGMELDADSVALSLEASVEGSMETPRATARLVGGLELSGVRIEEVDFRVEAPGFLDQAIEVFLTCRVFETWAQIGFNLSVDDVIGITSSPLLLTAGGPAGAMEGDRVSRITFDPVAKHLLVQDFEIRGNQGDVTLGASVTDFSSGEATVVARWETPPTIIDRLVSPGTVDSLMARWGNRGPFELEVQLEFAESEGDRLIEARGDLVLPGPATLAHFLPDGASVDSLGPLYSEFELALRITDDGISYDAEWDPSRTDWIDSSRIHVQGGPESLRIHDSHLEAMGVRLSADGNMESGVWDMTGRLEVTRADMLRLFAPSVGQYASANLVADLTFKGTTEAPDLAVSLQGEMLTDLLAIEEIEGSASWNQSGLSILLNLPRGMKIPVALDSMTVSYRSRNTSMDAFPGVLEMDAAGPLVRMAQVLRLDRDPDWIVDAETLGVSIAEGDLETEHPFRVRFIEESQAVIVENLALSGSLGRLTASGYAAPDSNDIQVDISLAIPQEPRARFPIPGLWPEVVEVEVRSQEDGGLTMKASATGLKMAGRENVGARLNLTAGKEVTEIDVVVDDGVTTFVDVDLRIPARLEVYPPSWSPVEGPLVGTGLFSELQIAWEHLVPGARPDQILVLEGALELGGTAKHPTMQSDLTARLPSDPSRPDYVLNLQARLDRSAEGDNTGGPEGLFAVVRLDRGASTVLTGSLGFPMTFGSGIRPDSMRTIELEIESEPLRLEEFNPLFPTDYTMKGLVDLDFKATGFLGDPVLEGSLVVSELDVSVARGGNVAGQADIRFSGTGLRPRVDGTVDIIGGVIPIPESSRDLLPDEGHAVLWETQGLPALTANPEDTSRAGGRVIPTVEPEIDVTIRIPSSLWIRGRQIDIELSGDLRIEYRGGSPIITGTLRTKGGRLTLFGRTFTPERGEVTFFGDDEFNPSLDIRLTTRVEQYEIIVTITGTTEEPKLDLSSIPDLDQGDIMSVLTFGKPSSELDGNQLELAAQRAAAMAAMHGAAEVGGALADPLGLDVLMYNPSGREGKSTIVMGKYLNPRALLKYEQALESGAGFFVTLEYSLDGLRIGRITLRNLRIETLVGTRQSGAEVSWSRDY